MEQNKDKNKTYGVILDPVTDEKVHALSREHNHGHVGITIQALIQFAIIYMEHDGTEEKKTS